MAFAQDSETEDYKQQPHSFPEYSENYTKNLFAPKVKPGKTFYVSVNNGNDKNKGTKKSPFKSIEAARDAIRNLKASSGLPKGGIHVILLKGTYNIESTIEFTSEDTGTSTSPIVYKGEKKGEVILTGGVGIDTKRFQVVSDEVLLNRLHPKAKGNVISVDLSKDNLASYFPGDGKYGQIALDGHMLQLAQWPNRGYHHIAKIHERGPTTRWLKPGEKPMGYSKENPTGGKFSFKEELSPLVQAEFERTGDMYAQGYFHNDWYFQHEPVGTVNEDVIQLLHHTRYGIVNKIKSIPRRVRLFNVLAELDQPGEWYFDKKEQRLYVWPIKGFEPGKSTIRFIGTKNKSINDSYAQPGDAKTKQPALSLIAMENTSYFTLSDFIIENTGNLAISIKGGEYNLLASNIIRNGAGMGVKIKDGKYNGITGCDFYALYAAFSISGGNYKTLEKSNNFATNNIIRNCRYRGYGVISLSGVGIYFAHNLLHSMNGAVVYNTTNLLMEYNEFYNIGYEMGDFNVAYCGANWYTMNNVLRYNFVHHLIEPGGHPVAAFRNDDGGAGLKIYGNVFYRPGRGSSQFDGPLNDFQNNITMDSYMAWWTLKKDTTKEAIQKKWDQLASVYGHELPKGDKGDFIYIMEQLIGGKGWLKSPWKDTFPELKAMIETNPWAQTFGNVNLNYMNKVRNPFHIHGGSGTIEGMESKKKGRFKDLPLEGSFELPVEIDLDAFEDISALDFRFKKGFKPMKSFKPIPFEKIGLIKDDFRKKPLDKKVYRSQIYERFKNEKGGRYNAKIVSARYPLPDYLK
ncbi:right-handed parallel beta-helix repeat-containing protein [Flavivirga eckloniae]|uniref:Right-handed parallel beta-helix repeat-containing protein n=2 Tax=Flavivirga eckloniae TaxID=1803846 RepID=A0A2K9PX92_9FLAO|nr:right-handed parallel beta-helix repeat-containing protein [Flavivirga eckloniae]